MTGESAIVQTTLRTLTWSAWFLRGLLRSAMILVCLVTVPAIGAAAQSLDANSMKTAKGFTWVSKSSANFDFFFEPGTLAEHDIEKIKRQMEESRAHVETLLGEAGGERTPIFIVDSRPRMKDLVGFETNGMANGNVSAMVYSDALNGLGAHEICHILAGSFWGSSHGLWVNEGLAVYSDNAWHSLPLHAVAKWLLDHGELIPLGNLMKDGWGKKYSVMATYPESGSFVKFLYEKYGLDMVKNIWQQGAKKAFRQSGKNLRQLEEEWRVELAKVDASSIQYKIR